MNAANCLCGKVMQIEPGTYYNAVNLICECGVKFEGRSDEAKEELIARWEKLKVNQG